MNRKDRGAPHNRRQSLNSVATLFQEVFPHACRCAEVRATAVIEVTKTVALEREDLVQEAVLRLWAELRRFNPVHAGLRTFTERVVTSQIRSVMRKATARRRLPTTIPAPAPPDLVGSVELRIDIRRALQTLPEVDIRVAHLLTDYTPTEVARKLKVARSTVYLSIGRIRALLVKAGLGPKQSAGHIGRDLRI